MGRPKSSRTPLSAAEKQRRYRARRDADVQRRQEYLVNEKEKWRKDVETGKKKTQKDKSEREQRVHRKKWREAHKRSNARKEALERLNGAKLNLELQKVNDQLRKAEQRAEKYKNHLQRLKNNNPSPRTKVNKLIGNLSGTSLRRTLLFHRAVAEEVRNKYVHSKRESDRQVIAGIVTSKIIMKYRLQRLVQEVLGFSRRRTKCATENVCRYQKNKCFTFVATDDQTEGPIHNTPEEVQWHSQEVVGKWCALVYDNIIYPGIITEVNETHCQVKCLHKVGSNRFYWPLRDDLHWYPLQDVLSLIPPPENVTSRHMAIAREVWNTLACHGK
ncbi:uncharacterized protein LOC115027144 [Cottoperca gobio]|uniref:Uncharacterized protein LOC115027144 n=1 Tax=Cottoperca gobio TaxID=56716 RepID=A0A6J2S396_COTGO|nr:uncharacterized protein LOC115027144 [Cottoperca gobio]